MTELTALWLPILLSAVFVFIASSIIHMAPLWHANDFSRFPKQDAILDALRPFAIPPGDYMMPWPEKRGDMRSPEFLEKRKKGPVLGMTVIPSGVASMGPMLIQWFVYCLVIGLFAGYIAGRALGPGAPYLQVFRFVGATAFIAYAMALPQLSIWYHRGWHLTLKSMFDGLIYACLTAGAFGWLWPK